MSRHDPSPDRDPRIENEIQWVPLATAPDQLVAEMWQELLREESIPCVLAPGDTVSFLGLTPTPVRLMVPADLKATAEEMLGDARGGDDAEGEPGET